MQIKKRILISGEHNKINSGFGKYTKEIISRLYRTQKYELAELASYCHQKDNDVPWKVYPASLDKNHPQFEEFQKNEINQFGQYHFDRTVLHFRPDIVFDIRDYWMFSYQEISPLRKYFNWIIAPTIDSVPQKTEWMMTYQNADLVLAHTQWGINFLQNSGYHINTGVPVSDSVDTELFKPVAWNKKYHKCKYGLHPESIVIGSVMRNQKRKLIAELFRSFKDILNKNQNKLIYLYLHTSYPEPTGWDLPALLQEYEIYNNVLFTYYCAEQNKIYVSPYKGPYIPCPDNGSLRAAFPNVIKGVSDKTLVEIYNIFDIYIQYAICEGLGIPQLEAASCGIPVFSVNYSAMEEVSTVLNAEKIKFTKYRELETNADRALPDNIDLINKIQEWLNSTYQQKKDKSLSIRKNLIANYSWDKTCDSLIKIFDSVQNKDFWDQPMQTNTKANVPNNLNNREFIYYIIDYVIMEPQLKQTYLIQNMIKNLDEQFTINKGRVVPIDRKIVVKNLETILNHKIVCEEFRKNPDLLLKNNDFLL